MLPLKCSRQQRLDLLLRQRRYRLALDHRAVGIAAVGADPQLGRGPVTLVRIQQELGELGRLAQTDRQHAGGQWVQGTGMAGLGRTVDPLDSLQRPVG